MRSRPRRTLTLMGCCLIYQILSYESCKCNPFSIVMCNLWSNQLCWMRSVFGKTRSIKTMCQVRVITVFTVFRLLTDFVCLYNYEFWLSLYKIVRSSVILLLPLFSIDYCSFEVIQQIIVFNYEIIFCQFSNCYFSLMINYDILWRH